MKKIDIEIKIIDIGKTIKVKTSSDSKAAVLIESLIGNEKLAITKTDAKGVALDFTLWFGHVNLAYDNLSLEDVGVEDNDVLILRSFSGREHAPEERAVKKKIPKLQVALIAIILFLLAGSTLIFVYYDEIFNGKIQSKEYEIKTLRKSVEKNEQTIGEYKTKLLVEENNSFLLAKTRDSLLNIMRQPQIFDLKVQLHNDYRQIIEQRYSYSYNAVTSFISFKFTIGANKNASLRYEDIYVCIEQDSVLRSNPGNFLVIDSEEFPYTFSENFYYSGDVIEYQTQLWDKNAIDMRSGSYKVKIYTKDGILLGENKFDL